MSNVVVWNDARAEDIRIRSVKALQGTADEMERVANEFDGQITRLNREREPLYSSLTGLLTRQANLSADTSRASRQSLQEDIDSTSRQIADIDANIAELQRSIGILRRAAEQIGRSISDTNRHMEALFAELSRIDGECANEVRRIKDLIIQYTNRKINTRDRFINNYFSSTVGGFPQIHNTSIFSINSREEIQAFVDVGLKVIDASCEDTFNALKITMGSLPLTDRIAILEIVLDGPEMYQDMFFATARYLNIASINAANVTIGTRVNREGKNEEYIRNIGSRGFFTSTPNNPLVHFNANADRDNDRGAFFTFFHEVGHMIDWVAAGSDNGHLFSRIDAAFSRPLFNAVSADVRRQVTIVANGLDLSGVPESRRSTYTERAINNIMNGQRIVAETPEEIAALTPAQEVQRDLQIEMGQVLRGAGSNARNSQNMINPSNVYGGVTNNAVRGSAWHPEPSYWFRDGNPTFNQNIEMFAHHFAASIRNDSQMLQNERDFFPSAMGTASRPGVFVNMVNEINARVVPEKEEEQDDED